ncbi:PAS domain S-box protein [Rhodocytophaga rosea]|uniref:PAS domain S-box protein n=1 Tax=Rhodocytophaga rosea TaxID=2704465 RepID=A0A6C0GIC6_9BACT|nr:PAS domain S-box protein [Rhodocytophaga rosea]QHT67719.1 PAS domain S-box protein [Rhodocytophaga rosea]
MALGNNIKKDQLIPANNQPETKKGAKNSMKSSVSVDDQYSQILEALSKSQAVIEFNMDGTVITANENFLNLLGYTLADVKGKHHRIFCQENYSNSTAYKKFWENLNKGRFDAAQYKRIGKDGKEIWIQATYNPILDGSGKPYKVVKFATDITEQKKMEAEINEASGQLKRQEADLQQNMEKLQDIQEDMKQIIRESQAKEQYLNDLINVSKDSIFTVDREYKIISFNETLKHSYTSLGIDLQKGTDMLQILGEEERIKLIVNYQKAFQGETIEVTQSFSTNNVESHYLMTYSPLRNENGDIIAAAVFSKDISALVQAQKQAESLLKEARQQAEEMKAQEEELRQNMEEVQATQDEMARKQIELDGQIAALNNAAIVSEVDLKGHILAVNDEFCRLAKYTREELIGQKQSIVRHPDMPGAVFDDLWATITKGKVWRGEVKNRAKDGSHYWVAATITPVLNENGRPVKYIGVRFDITAQKEQEEEIKRNMQEMARKQIELDGQMAALNNAAIVSEVDLKGNILAVNDEFCRLAKYTREELIGQKQSIVRHPDMPSAVFDDLWATITKGKVWRGEVKNRAKDGSHYWVAATITPVLNENGRPVKYIGVRFDTTAQKEQEVKIKDNVEQMQKAVDMQKANLLGFEQATKFIQELTIGNFNSQMNVAGLEIDENVSGVISNLNSLRNTLKEIISEVNQVVKLAGEEGKLNARLNVKENKGEWKVLLDSMNLLLASISEPVLEFNSIIAEMAKGDLTNKFQMKVNGDILNMASSLNTAITNLSDLLSTIGLSSDVVADSSKGMMKKSESMKNNTTEVASAISQMAKGAQEQAIKTDASSKLVEEVLRSANTMEQKANVINKAAEKGQKGSEDGLKIVKRLVENMGEIGESAKKTSGSIDILTQRAEEIARTLNVITDIAAQTNLLALNAAIEAARAGDAGRGFAVVAEEIRKLAEDSRRSAVDIEKIIKDVQKDTLAAGKAIETMHSSVKMGDNASKEAESIFQEIAKSSNETFSFSKEIQEATSEQKSSISAVVKNIEQIVVVAEETAAGTQQVASSSQQLNQGMNDITEASAKLSQVAAELQTGVSKFKLKK